MNSAAVDLLEVYLHVAVGHAVHLQTNTTMQLAKLQVLQDRPEEACAIWARDQSSLGSESGVE